MITKIGRDGIHRAILSQAIYIPAILIPWWVPGDDRLKTGVMAGRNPVKNRITSQ